MLKRRLTDSMCSAWSARARRPGWFVLVQVRFRKRRVGKWDFWSVYGVPPGRPLFVLIHSRLFARHSGSVRRG